MHRDSDRERRNMMGICGLSSRILTLAALALSLAGCGGGGSTNTTGVTLSVTPLNISVSAISTQSAPTPSFVVNFSSQHQIGQVFVGIAVGGKGIDQVVNNGGQLPVTIPIELLRPSSLGPGTYDGTVKVSGCLDNACAQPVADSPQTIHVQYTVTLSPLIVSGFSPTTAYVGGAAFSLAVSGSSFTSQSTVLWNGAQLATSYVDGTTLSAQVPASDLAKAGNVTISISDPTYGISAGVAFPVRTSPMTVTSLSPSNTVAVGPAFTLTVNGSGFTSQSTVLWNGNPQTTTFVNATKLTAQIPAADITGAGDDTVSVDDPVFGLSTSQTFTVTPRPYGLDSVSPTTVSSGGTSFMLTALGAEFSATSTIEWNGTPLTTTLVSPTELVAQVPATDIGTTGTASVVVSDPSQTPSTTGTETVTIAAPSIDAVSYQINAAHNGAVTFANVSLPFPTTPTWTVTMGGTPSFAIIADGKVIVSEQTGSGAAMQAMDQGTGAIVWGPVLLDGPSTPAYDNGMVFVVGNGLSSAVLQAYDADTGNLEWSDTLPSFASVTGFPTATGGTVYVISDFTLEAVDETTGSLLWTQTVNGTAMSAAVTVDGVYTTSSCQTADLRPATGEFVWDYTNNCSSGNEAMPVIADLLDFATLNRGGGVFDAEQGGQYGLGYQASATLAATSTMAYLLEPEFLGGLETETLSGMTLPDFTTQWTFTGDGHLIGAPIVVNQYVFVGSSSGNLYALDGTTGAQVWNVNLGNVINTLEVDTSVPFSGLSAGDGLLIVSAGGKIFAFTLSTNP